jgi:hypothetical protein
MNQCNLPFLGIAAALLFVAPPCAAQKVTTTLDNGFDFESSKRYAWGQNHIITRQGRANDALIGEKIVQEVNRTLAAKGFTEDPSSPDFYISYDAGASDLAADMEGANTGHPPVSTTTIGPVYGVPPNLWYSVDGHIIFHITEAKSNKPVWTAVATKKIRDPHKGMKDMPKQVEQLVSKTFKKFPPSRK